MEYLIGFLLIILLPASILFNIILLLRGINIVKQNEQLVDTIMEYDNREISTQSNLESMLSKMKDLIKQNYELIGKLWRLIKVLIDFCSLNNSNANFEVDILASALGTIFEWSELNKKFKS